MADDSKSYSCVACGETFPKEKDLKKHKKDCEMTVAKRLDDMLKTIALLVTNHADMVKKLTDIEKKTGHVAVADGSDDEADVVVDDADVSTVIKFAVRNGKLYRYNKELKTYHLADIPTLITAMVKRDYGNL
jgi:hypothetical protein